MASAPVHCASAAPPSATREASPSAAASAASPPSASATREASPTAAKSDAPPSATREASPSAAASAASPPSASATREASPSAAASDAPPSATREASPSAAASAASPPSASATREASPASSTTSTAIVDAALEARGLTRSGYSLPEPPKPTGLLLFESCKGIIGKQIMSLTPNKHFRIIHSNVELVRNCVIASEQINDLRFPNLARDGPSHVFFQCRLDRDGIVLKGEVVDALTLHEDAAKSALIYNRLIIQRTIGAHLVKCDPHAIRASHEAVRKLKQEEDKTNSKPKDVKKPRSRTRGAGASPESRPRWQDPEMKGTFLDPEHPEIKAALKSYRSKGLSDAVIRRMRKTPKILPYILSASFPTEDDLADDQYFMLQWESCAIPRLFEYPLQNIAGYYRFRLGFPSDQRSPSDSRTTQRYSWFKELVYAVAAFLGITLPLQKKLRSKYSYMVDAIISCIILAPCMAGIIKDGLLYMRSTLGEGRHTADDLMKATLSQARGDPAADAFTLNKHRRFTGIDRREMSMWFRGILVYDSDVANHYKTQSNLAKEAKADSDDIIMPEAAFTAEIHRLYVTACAPKETIDRINTTVEDYMVHAKVVRIWVMTILGLDLNRMSRTPRGD
ncbi:hypothetical protein BJ508DRAFT_334987 [Ascobolus immersus RN42]|uniref:Uncharacterized protein n=1 Tax=Ascobolus immersus RN42 TaxID=1160509 RepID=A0A3N4HKS9_ASCIM|nr:hypothetical protein BJ508DRAFT_334987 [Ascobolus immersus RN42]